MFQMLRRHGFRIKSWSSKKVETMSVIFTVIALLVLTV